MEITKSGRSGREVVQAWTGWWVAGAFLYNFIAIILQLFSENTPVMNDSPLSQVAQGPLLAMVLVCSSIIRKDLELKFYKRVFCYFLMIPGFVSFLMYGWFHSIHALRIDKIVLSFFGTDLDCEYFEILMWVITGGTLGLLYHIEKLPSQTLRVLLAGFFFHSFHTFIALGTGGLKPYTLHIDRETTKWACYVLENLALSMYLIVFISIRSLLSVKGPKTNVKVL